MHGISFDYTPTFWVILNNVVRFSLNIFINLFHYFHSILQKSFFICEVCNYDLLRLVPRPQWTQSSTVVVSKATKNLNLIYPLVCTSLEVVQIFRWKKYVMLTKPPQLKRRSVQHNSILSQLFVLGIYPFFLR